MKIPLILVAFLTAFTLFAATPAQVPSPSPFVLQRKVRSVQIMPDGTLELLKQASWEDAAYAVLEFAKDVDLARQTCNNELSNLKNPKTLDVPKK